jgi:hypothetical protein
VPAWPSDKKSRYCWKEPDGGKNRSTEENPDRVLVGVPGTYVQRHTVVCNSTSCQRCAYVELQYSTCIVNWRNWTFLKIFANWLIF